MTREEGIKSSIEKWAGIKKKLEGKIKQHYNTQYWCPCGYCAWVMSNNLRMCRDCPLFMIHKGIKVCSDSGEHKSWAYKALELADQEKYEEALECCDIVIAFMREDLKK